MPAYGQHVHSTLQVVDQSVSTSVYILAIEFRNQWYSNHSFQFKTHVLALQIMFSYGTRIITISILDSAMGIRRFK